uniref:Uncharacterized protein n=1 Tax=Plectus sambesii TaxID=2011161 RepID=A0A914WLG0_9BILA
MPGRRLRAPVCRAGDACLSPSRSAPPLPPPNPIYGNCISSVVRAVLMQVDQFSQLSMKTLADWPTDSAHEANQVRSESARLVDARKFTQRNYGPSRTVIGQLGRGSSAHGTLRLADALLRSISSPGKGAQMRRKANIGPAERC